MVCCQDPLPLFAGHLVIRFVAPPHLRVFGKHSTTYLIEERRLLKDEPQEGTPWLTALKNPDTVTSGEAEYLPFCR